MARTWHDAQLRFAQWQSGTHVAPGAKMSGMSWAMDDLWRKECTMTMDNRKL